MLTSREVCSEGRCVRDMESGCFMSTSVDMLRVVVEPRRDVGEVIL